MSIKYIHIQVSTKSPEMPNKSDIELYAFPLCLAELFFALDATQ
jgi:hypothetical protein